MGLSGMFGLHCSVTDAGLAWQAPISVERQEYNIQTKAAQNSENENWTKLNVEVPQVRDSIYSKGLFKMYFRLLF